MLNCTTYRTLPNNSASLLKLAVGGDVGMTAQGVAMTNHLIAYDPDVILLGGDLVYDNAIRNCYYSWDNFYSMF
jgi:3D (Asp-Asp-Asp) domain-containing protein